MGQFVNFTSAARKPYFVPFNYFGPNDDLSWIAGALFGQPTYEDLSSQITSGAGQTFTLTSAPTAWTGSLELYWEGAKLKQGTHYTLAGATVTMLAPYEPATGQVFECYYWTVTSNQTATDISLSWITATETADGIITTFTFSSAPTLVSVNGVLTEFTASGTTVTFSDPPAANAVVKGVCLVAS